MNLNPMNLKEPNRDSLSSAQATTPTQSASNPKSTLSPQAQPKAQNDNFDLIVIGGGINGSGITRDAAERGLKVLLLEKNDLGAGTTAYSTRLIHGGLRYLENLEVGLVRESLRERERLLQNAPHLVKPLQLGIPVYEGDKRGKWMIRLGMMVYGLLSMDKSMPGFQMLSKSAFLKQFNGVNPQKLTGGAVYYDAQVNLPERVCVENAIAAQETRRAVIRNHSQVDRILFDEVHDRNVQATGVEYTDLLTGERHMAKGKVIVNAAGPWVDQVASLSQRITPNVQGISPLQIKRMMGGTKGSHIIVKRFPGGPDKALYVEAQTDGRPYFIVPWLKDYYLIGTTDLPYQGDLDKVVAGKDEVDYLLSETNRVLPEAHLTRNDVLFSYSGVRPLPYAGDTTAGKITRKHLIVDHRTDDHRTKQEQNPSVDFRKSNFVSVVGGKLTTYRNLAEQTVDLAIRHYKLRREDGHPLGASTTRNTPLPGGVGLSQKSFEAYRTSHAVQAAQQFGVPVPVAEQLIDLYGARYEKILALTTDQPELKQPLTSGSSRIAAQVVYAVESEFAKTVTDVMRRTGAHFSETVGLDEVDAVADWMGRLNGWSGEEKQRQVADYRQWVQDLNLAFRQPNSG